MTIEQEILRDLRSLTAKLEQYRHTRHGRMTLTEQLSLWEKIEPQLESFWLQSIILLPPESSGSRCPKCGHAL